MTDGNAVWVDRRPSPQAADAEATEPSTLSCAGYDSPSVDRHDDLL